MGVHSTVCITRRYATDFLIGNIHEATDEELSRIMDVFADRLLLNVVIVGEDEENLDGVLD